MTDVIKPKLGRPPIYNLEDMAQKLSDWSQKDDSTALCQFCAENDIYADYIYEWRDKSEIFSIELKKAKMRIAKRLREKLHNKEFPYNYGLFMSEIGYHDQFHHDYTESIKDKEAKRRKDIEGSKQSNYTIVVPHDLAVGANIPAQTLPDKTDSSSE